jgi:adenylylsulfate kinase
MGLIKANSMASKINKILICGLPGSGKTTLARPLASRLGAVWFNGDEVRSNLNKDLGFSIVDRIEQAKRMGWLCDRVVDAGGIALADFVCPTPETREAFGESFVIWINRIEASRYEDTNRIFIAPRRRHVEIDHTMTPARGLTAALEAWRTYLDDAFPKFLRSHAKR